MEILTKEEATALVNKIETIDAQYWQTLTDLYIGQGWVALGYTSWDEMVTNELDHLHVRLPREERRGVVKSLRQAGLSTRAIADVTGINRETIRQEIAGDNKLSSAPITGKDGKTYQPKATPASVVTPVQPDEINSCPVDAPEITKDKFDEIVCLNRELWPWAIQHFTPQRVHQIADASVVEEWIDMLEETRNILDDYIKELKK